MSRQIVSPAKLLRGALSVPGDKSISHRCLLFSGIGEGICEIHGLSPSDDVAATWRALAQLGVVMRLSNGKSETSKLSTQELDRRILVDGAGWSGLKPSASTIFCQNSGTTARTL